MLGRLFSRSTQARLGFLPSLCTPTVWLPCRKYSVVPTANADLDASSLTVEKTKSPKELTPAPQLMFGHTFTDHMLTIEWASSKGWLPARILPYQNLSLDPATCVFHYAFECFEGLKAYKDKEDNTRLFRPDKNMQRFNISAARIALPTFNGSELINLISELVKVDDRWIPRGKGYSLYLRPTLIGTQKTIGISPTGSALLYVIASPVGPYYPTGFKAVKLMATRDRVRAWPGGTGSAKIGANYSPCVVPQIEAAKQGYHQNLWLFGPEDYLTEVGTMNLFVAWTNERGEKELVTAPLDGMILDGVTRDSILSLARERLASEGWKTSERKITMPQVRQAAQEGRLLEVFGAGTAAIVSPVRTIYYEGEDIEIPLQPGKEAGPLAEKMKTWIEGIQYGEEPNNPWSVVVR